MTLRQKQSLFAKKIALLINYIYDAGYEVTFGDAFRDERCPYGSEKSFHHKRLAIDLNLFKDGRYLSSTEAHRFAGEFWESIGGTWGGRFGSSDGNHYSWGEGK